MSTYSVFHEALPYVQGGDEVENIEPTRDDDMTAIDDDSLPVTDRVRACVPVQTCINHSFRHKHACRAILSFIDILTHPLCAYVSDAEMRHTLYSSTLLQDWANACCHIRCNRCVCIREYIYTAQAYCSMRAYMRAS